MAGQKSIRSGQILVCISFKTLINRLDLHALLLMRPDPSWPTHLDQVALLLMRDMETQTFSMLWCFYWQIQSRYAMLGDPGQWLKTKPARRAWSKAHLSESLEGQALGLVWMC